jgi:hypothetical protein
MVIVCDFAYGQQQALYLSFPHRQVIPARLLMSGRADREAEDELRSAAYHGLQLILLLYTRLGRGQTRPHAARTGAFRVGITLAVRRVPCPWKRLVQGPKTPPRMPRTGRRPRALATPANAS